MKKKPPKKKRRKKPAKKSNAGDLMSHFNVPKGARVRDTGRVEGEESGYSETD